MQKSDRIVTKIKYDESDENKMKNRTLAGNCGIAVFTIAFLAIVIAFATPNWLGSDSRFTGAKLDRLGLWVHCYNSLPDVNDDSQKRFFVGCRWVYDPFTKGWDEIRGFLLPPFMIATQFFFTLTFIGMLVSCVGVLVFFLCAGPDQKHFLLLIRSVGYVLLGSGICAVIAVIVFAVCGNRNDWMPQHANNWFDWSFVLACVGAVLTIGAAVLFHTEAYVQRRRLEYKRSQTRFELVKEGMQS